MGLEAEGTFYRLNAPMRDFPFYLKPGLVYDSVDFTTSDGSPHRDHPMGYVFGKTNFVFVAVFSVTLRDNGRVCYFLNVYTISFDKTSLLKILNISLQKKVLKEKFKINGKFKKPTRFKIPTTIRILIIIQKKEL